VVNMDMLSGDTHGCWFENWFELDRLLELPGYSRSVCCCYYTNGL